MRLSVRTLGMETTDAIRDHVERRVRFAVGRFGHRLEEVSVRLGDANGPRGGTDKTCRLVATLGGTGQVVVDDADADLYVGGAVAPPLYAPGPVFSPRPRVISPFLRDLAPDNQVHGSGKEV